MVRGLLKAVGGIYKGSLIESKCGTQKFRSLFYWIHVLTDKRVYGVDTYLLSSLVAYLLYAVEGYDVNLVPSSPLGIFLNVVLIAAIEWKGYLGGMLVSLLIPFITGMSCPSTDLLEDVSLLTAVYVLGFVKRG